MKTYYFYVKSQEFISYIIPETEATDPEFLHQYH